MRRLVVLRRATGPGRLALLAGALLLLLGAGLLLALRSGDAARPGGDRGGAPLAGAAREGFRVEGNRLYDPAGRPFTVRGVVMPYGTFAGGPGASHDRLNFERLPDDLRRVRRAGANLIRVFASPDAARPARFARLERTVALARAEGLVVQLSGAFATFAQARPWVRRLAERFHADPWVWIQPMNEPQCTTDADRAAGWCEDWGRWQREHRAYVRDIRAAGVRSPIVVNGPAFSFDLRPIARHPLGDDAILYGAHRYGNTHAEFDASERTAVEQGIAQPSRTHPVLVDEIGSFNGPQFPNSLAWAKGMTRWIAEWTARGDGLGATGFNWRWSDPNSMLGPDDRLSPWGEVFVRTVLRGRRPTG